jgi:microcystin degradation protein MlrC
MKVFCSTLIHETSRQSPIPTDLDSFREAFLYVPTSGEGSHWCAQNLDGVDWTEILKEQGHEAAYGLLAGAQPSRPISSKTWKYLLNEIRASLRAAMPVDFVALSLHGAQVAEDVDDCAGEVLATIRVLVGPDIPVGAVLDLHGNMSERMMENADILLSCLEYPHVDTPDRARQLVELLATQARGKIRSTMARRRVPMLGTYYTTRSPMREFVDWAKSFEDRVNILAVSVTHGFPKADVADCMAQVIVCADGDPAGARRVADEIADRYFSLRDAINPSPLSSDAAVTEALKARSGPVVIADIADNPGGGAGGDSTHLLRALLRAGARDCALGMIWDPVAADFAAKAGIGARLPLRIGGKTGAAAGTPVDFVAQVIDASDNAAQQAQGMTAPLGRAALVEANGIKVVLNSVRQQVFDPACFETLGVVLSACRIVVVKSRQHFYERFGTIASRVIYADTACDESGDHNLALTKIARPIYPLDNPPFDAYGRRWG